MTVVIHGCIPVWIKLLYFAFVAILVPLYWPTYGRVELPLLLRYRAARHGRGHLDRKSPACQHAGGRDRSAADAVGGRSTGARRCRRGDHWRDRLRAGCEYSPLSPGPFVISRLVAVLFAVVAVAPGLRSSGARHPVRGCNRGLAGFLSFRSGAAAFGERSDPRSQYQLCVRLHGQTSANSNVALALGGIRDGAQRHCVLHTDSLRVAASVCDYSRIGRGLVVPWSNAIALVSGIAMQ